MTRQWFEVKRHHEDPHDDLRTRDILADIDKALKRAENYTPGFKAAIREDLCEPDAAVVVIDFSGDLSAAADSLSAALRIEHLQASPIDGRRFSA